MTAPIDPLRAAKRARDRKYAAAHPDRVRAKVKNWRAKRKAQRAKEPT